MGVCSSKPDAVAARPQKAIFKKRKPYGKMIPIIEQMNNMMIAANEGKTMDELMITMDNYK